MDYKKPMYIVLKMIAGLPWSIVQSIYVGFVVAVIFILPEYGPIAVFIETHSIIVSNALKMTFFVAITYYFIVSLARLFFDKKNNSGYIIPAIAKFDPSNDNYLDSMTKSRLAIHEAGHLLSYSLFKTKPIEINAWIVDKKNQNIRGRVVAKYSVEPETKEYKLDKMRCLLAGAIAEIVILGQVDSGSQSDYKQWEILARDYLLLWGREDDYNWFECPSNEAEAKINLETLSDIRKKQWVFVKKQFENNRKLLEETRDKLIDDGEIGKLISLTYIDRMKISNC